MKIFNLLELKRLNKSLERNFKRDYSLFSELNDDRFSLSKADWFPCLNDRTENTEFDAHYIYHPAWAARIVKSINPSFHTDISSTLNFCAILSAFVDVKFYDFRPAKLSLSGLTSEKIDLTNIHFADNSLESVSCMHTIEHIGLGRYGDPIDPKGDVKAINELKRIVAPNGNLLLVMPVGKPKIMFNAHRIYSFEMIMEVMQEGFILEEFSMIYDNQDFVRNSDPEDVKKQNYGCGCFWFKKE